MTAVEFILIIQLWIIIGTWISYKRNWYKDFDSLIGKRDDAIACNIIFAPLVLVIVLVFRLFVEPWEKN